MPDASCPSGGMPRMPDASSPSGAPRVSVVIPTHDAGRFLPEALESVFAEPDVGAEVVVVDDGSSEPTRRILDPWIGRIRFLETAHQGVSAARNLGLQEARSEFVVFLDADDVSIPGRLAAQLERFEAQPSLDMVHAGWDVIDAGGVVLESHRPWCDAPELDLVAWLERRPIALGALMFRRARVLAVGGFDRALETSEDLDLILRLARDGARAAWLETKALRYRRHAANVSLDVERAAAGSLHVLRRFFDAPALPPWIRRLESRVLHHTRIWWSWRLFEAGHRDAAVEGLVEAAGLRRPGLPEPLRWYLLFDQAARGRGRSPAAWPELAPLLRTAAERAGLAWPAHEAAIGWWMQVRAALADGRSADAARAYVALSETDPEVLISARHLALLDPLELGPTGLAPFAAELGATGATRGFESSLLDLAFTLRHARPRDWRAVVGVCWRALRRGARPSAAPAWVRLLRTLPGYLRVLAGR